jgi:hypothetical protein
MKDLISETKNFLSEASDSLLTRKFSDEESNYPYIVPALKNGMEVKVTEKIAKLFALADLELVANFGPNRGDKHHIKFSKPKNGIVSMSLIRS